ncbi:MAG TPA: hypothetical protein VLT83_06620, partial [Opitutaceae bacterium]|nr:hypothetical protein [Opitutaceae bacterium]
ATLPSPETLDRIELAADCTEPITLPMLPVESARKNTSTVALVGEPALTVTVLSTVTLPPTATVAETLVGEMLSANPIAVDTQSMPPAASNVAILLMD